MATKARDRAFPGSHNVNEEGITKREYFAALAMQGVLARGDKGGPSAAGTAVMYADHLIEALNKEKEQAAE